MDLKLAKKVIIISLIITNLVLFFFIYMKNEAYKDETNEKAFIERTIALLKEKNIEVETEIPREKYMMKTLSVEFEKIELEELSRRFFKDMVTVKNEREDNGVIRKDDITILLINRRRILYENEKPRDYTINSVEDAINDTKDFLLKHGFSEKDLVLVKAEEKNGSYNVEYRKLYEEKFLETSYTNFVLEKNGISKMDRLWLNVIETSDRKLSPGSASRALLSLLDREEINKKKTIVKIEPCYYFDPEEQGYLDDITKALRGRAIPSWRIEFKDGTDIVVENI